MRRSFQRRYSRRNFAGAFAIGGAGGSTIGAGRATARFEFFEAPFAGASAFAGRLAEGFAGGTGFAVRAGGRFAVGRATDFCFFIAFFAFGKSDLLASTPIRAQSRVGRAEEYRQA